MSFLLIGVDFFIAHLFGDYVFQNNWMANHKTQRWLPAIVHGFVYSLCYIPVLLAVNGFTERGFFASLIPWAVIFVTHVVIDHWRLIKSVIWAVNQIAPKNERYSWIEAKANGGFPAATPVWLATWLMIIADNTIHLAINAISVFWL